ncbi:unnamed protein product [Durusdinium trenchii]|uniref:Uncharacterized protein n=2 Tax=Durusdinium trenchii TaxID=1381693 RepID=A0ABP0STI2_9DINO
MKGCSLEIQETPDRGRGLFALRKPTGKPAMLFSEAPLGRVVQMSKSSRRRGGACFLCGHALGSPAWQLSLLTKGDISLGHEQQPLSEPLSDIVEGKPLFWKRKPLFCSSQCNVEYERILGPLRARRKSAQKFAQYVRKVDCAFHMLALKLICWCLAEAKRTTPAEAAAPLQVLCCRPYWDAVDMPSEHLGDNVTFKEKLRNEAEKARQLALKALGGRAALPHDWNFLNETGYANLLGALCSNCTVVLYMSPVLQHILQVTSMTDCAAKAAALAALEPPIRSLIASQTSKIGTQQARTGHVRDQEISWETPSGRLSFSSSIIPPFKGYAIYPRMAFMNHSCRPTCAIEFDYTAQIFVLQQPYNDMDKGTELTISYLDSSLDAQADLIAMGRKRRRQELLPYGIECSCHLESVYYFHILLLHNYCS